MYLHSYKVKNFRRLKNAHVDLEKDISIFVGANNSGKTSATHLIQLFVSGTKDKFSIHDFSVDCWDKINEIGKLKEDGDARALTEEFPNIVLDLWFSVTANDLGRVIDILPSLAWAGSYVGVRITLAPSNVGALLDSYIEAKNKAPKNTEGGEQFKHWPSDLCDYIGDNLGKEFEFKYYVLDQASFNADFEEQAGYQPLELNPDKGRTGPQILKSIIRVDCLDAQRHLSDISGSRSENLSKCLSRFYSRNLKKSEDDPGVKVALARAKAGLDDHFEDVFGDTLHTLSDIGYPGLDNPKLIIKSALNPATIMGSQDGAVVHYCLDKNSGGVTGGYTLPDRYNGLGFKNLIYMVIELLDLHTQWLESDDVTDHAPLHLVFIEEPEAHLHVQLQQVFVRKILDILKLDKSQLDYYLSQLVITTHSPHILFERGFRPIRYFRKSNNDGVQVSEVVNLSKFYSTTAEPERDFLERYMKLTHCDLFFADGAILVEGNVERLLMPLMIEKSADKLKSSCLSILEIGGAYGYRFKALVEYLGLTTLLVTDLDSVFPPVAGVEAEVEEDDRDDEEDQEAGASTPGTACLVNFAGANTCNQTLIQWLPKMTLIEELLAATNEQKTQTPTTTSVSHIRIAYQKQREITWQGETVVLAGRTFEEDFAYENLVWSQGNAQKDIGLRIAKNDEKNLTALSTRIFKRVKGSRFDKTDFALAVLGRNPVQWRTPMYIDEGLKWLSDQLSLVKNINEAIVDPEVVETVSSE